MAHVYAYHDSPSFTRSNTATGPELPGRFGVLLYELLTGKTPFDPQSLLQAGLDQMRRIIREQEPQRPSTRLSTLADADLTTAASHRRIEPPRLVNLIRGDLDWIAMKALEKDRTRRYETADGLAADVQRHLRNEPVAARPPSQLYRLHKAVQRHRLDLAAVVSIATTLVIGTTVSFTLRKPRRFIAPLCAWRLATSGRRPTWHCARGYWKQTRVERRSHAKALPSCWRRWRRNNGRRGN